MIFSVKMEESRFFVCICFCFWVFCGGFCCKEGILLCFHKSKRTWKNRANCCLRKTIDLMNFMFYISKFDCFNFYERWAICMMKNISYYDWRKRHCLLLRNNRITVVWPGYKHCQGPIIHLDLFFIDERMLPN